MRHRHYWNRVSMEFVPDNGPLGPEGVPILANQPGTTIVTYRCEECSEVKIERLSGDQRESITSAESDSGIEAQYE